MKIYVAALFLLVNESRAWTPQKASDADESAAIRQVALDYIEGWYTGDAERMGRALHPELAKRTVNTSAVGQSVLGQMSALTLVESTRAGGGRSIPENQRAKDVRVLDTFRNAASVRIDAATWVDYLHLAKWNGRWVIVNVLWESKDSPPAPTPTATTPNGAGTRASGTLEGEMAELYARQADAVLAQDAAALMAFNAADHQVKLLNGDSLSRAKLEEGLTAFYASGRLVKELSFSFDVLDVALHGEDAVALVEQKDHRVQIRSDGKPHEIDARVLHRDSWRMTPAGWRRYLTEEVLEVRFAVDGVPTSTAEHRPSSKDGK